ncbi:MAG TPA: polyketide synthase dehydratase domain-containing protein, partial [Pyrinomonadaceae bacterium]
GGYNTFVEVSPHPVLVGALDECLGERRGECVAMPSLRRREDERSTMLKSAGRLYTRGLPLAWEALQAEDGRYVQLPSYQWQRTRYWLKEQETRNDRRRYQSVEESDATSRRGIGALLGRCIASAVEPETYHWEFEIDTARVPYLADHHVGRMIVVPAAAFIEMASAGAAELLKGAGFDPVEVRFEQALALREGETRKLQLVIKRESGGALGFQLFSREQGDNLQSPWTLHGRGQLQVREGVDEVSGRLEPDEVRERCRASLTGEDFYREMSGRGLVYGPSFRGVQQVWQRDGEAIARISLDGAVSEDGAPAGGVHPLLLDNCLQVIACALPLQTGQAEGVTYLPVGVGRVRVGRANLPAGVAWSYATLQTPVEDLPPVLTADASLLTESGEVVLELRGVRLQRVRSSVRPEAARAQQAADESRRVAEEDTGRWLYEIDWRKEELPTTRTPDDGHTDAQGKWLIFADEGGVGEAVRSRLEVEDADACVLVRAGRSYRRIAPNEFEIDPASARDFDQLLAEATDFGAAGWRGVLHLWGLEAQAQLTADDLAQVQTTGSRSVLNILQSLDRAGLAR